jgi:hypothetical protein
MNFSLQSVLGVLKFFLRDPKQQVEIEAAEATLALEEAIAKMPEEKRWQDAVSALFAAEGWLVDRHPATGAIIGVTPPDAAGVGGHPHGADSGLMRDQ